MSRYLVFQFVSQKDFPKTEFCPGWPQICYPSWIPIAVIKATTNKATWKGKGLFGFHSPSHNTPPRTVKTETEAGTWEQELRWRPGQCCFLASLHGWLSLLLIHPGCLPRDGPIAMGWALPHQWRRGPQASLWVNLMEVFSQLRFPFLRWLWLQSSWHKLTSSPASHLWLLVQGGFSFLGWGFMETGWPQILYTAEDNAGFLISLPLPLEHREHRHDTIPSLSSTGNQKQRLQVCKANTLPTNLDSQPLHVLLGVNSDSAVHASTYT